MENYKVLNNNNQFNILYTKDKIIFDTFDLSVFKLNNKYEIIWRYCNDEFINNINKILYNKINDNYIKIFMLEDNFNQFNRLDNNVIKQYSNNEFLLNINKVLYKFIYNKTSLIIHYKQYK